MHQNPRSCRQGIVPPYLLLAIARNGDPAQSGRARAALALDEQHRLRRSAPPPVATAAQAAPGRAAATAARTTDDGTGPLRTISDAGSTTTLPGHVVRREGAPAVGDPAADEAYDGLGATWSLFHDVYGRDSLDDAGLALDASVHYGQDYDNAFWDGSRMVFGDGDGRVFQRFTVAVDVIGHELTHGVTEKTAGLTYQGQSGALNESLSDVFGSLVKQRSLGQDAGDADWLIGAGLFQPSVQGVALRSMKAPGTAYDDPVLGRDPQPATMAGYVDTTDDNGGVHTNSGIPNHAFYLAATAIGGPAWEGAGQVWYDVLTGGALAADADFAAFAALTADAADQRFGAGSAQARAVRDAWDQVGVSTGGGAGGGRDVPEPTPAPTPGPPDGGGDVPPSAVVRVQRSGGLMGRSVEHELELQVMPAELADRWRTLLGSGALHDLPAAEPAPDRYVYRVLCPALDLDVTSGEQQLPDDLQATFEALLRLR